MPFIACGINHKTATIAVREQVAFSDENAKALLHELQVCGIMNETVILSTCNRTELYGQTSNVISLNEWLIQHPKLRIAANNLYLYQDFDAVRHVMRVACGLDSMALGEPQILGQMKQAFALAQQSKVVGSKLHRLFHAVFTVTKLIRTETGIGVHPVSIAYCAVMLAKRIFTQLSKCSVLLIGAGETIDLTATHLKSNGIKRIVIANHNPDKAQQLAAKHSSHCIDLKDVPVYLPKADIVICATASPLPILGKGMIERGLKLRKHRPLFMLDLAVPRDIEPEAASLEDVYLYNIDHLQLIIEENRKSREKAAEEANAIIDIYAHHFIRELRTLDAAETIHAFRSKVECLRDQELTNMLERLKRGESAQDLLAQMAYSLTNKIMHTPTVRLREAALDGQLELLLMVRKLFDV